MKDHDSGMVPWAHIELQPGDTRELPERERDTLIVSATSVDGQWVILSRYRDECWQNDGMPTNVRDNRRRLNFQHVPAAFRAVMKAVTGSRPGLI